MSLLNARRNNGGVVAFIGSTRIHRRRPLMTETGLSPIVEKVPTGGEAYLPVMTETGLPETEEKVPGVGDEYRPLMTETGLPDTVENVPVGGEEKRRLATVVVMADLVCRREARTRRDMLNGIGGLD